MSLYTDNSTPWIIYFRNFLFPMSCFLGIVCFFIFGPFKATIIKKNEKHLMNYLNDIKMLDFAINKEFNIKDGKITITESLKSIYGTCIESVVVDIELGENNSINRETFLIKTLYTDSAIDLEMYKTNLLSDLDNFINLHQKLKIIGLWGRWKWGTQFRFDFPGNRSYLLVHRRKFRSFRKNKGGKPAIGIGGFYWFFNKTDYARSIMPYKKI